MDSSEENTEELLENVTISDGSQYMIQRMTVENPQLLNTDLLHHNSLVVDLAGGDFIPVNYASDDLLSQDLTDEDRNLAAALVAVQLSHKQQLQQDTNTVISNSLPSLVSSTSIDVSKVDLSDQHLILTDKGSSINGGYLQIVGTDNLALPKLIDTRFSTQEVYNSNLHVKSNRDNEEIANLHDSDGENKIDTRSSKKSLPHKKRISRKLKKPCASSRKLHKCNLCEQSFNNNEDFSSHQTLCQTTITPVNSSGFSCQICNAGFQDQLRFFEHLKSHYEPTVPVGNNVSQEDDKTVIKTESDLQRDTLLSSLLNLTCIQCSKTFRRQKAYEAHVRDVHNKVELNEFSEPEDLMEGIDVVVDNGQTSEEDTKVWSKYRDDELQATEADLRELEAQDHVCHICNQPFPIRAILLQHLVTCRVTNQQTESTNTSVIPKKKGRKKVEELCCTECDRVFTHRNSLVYHMRSHTGDRPHQCDQCGKSFFAASALKVHLRLHSGDKPYRCESCGRQFRQWGDLKYHCISIHSDQKQYQCEFCGKDFARKYSLVVHRRIHTGEKNYRCEFCGKTFRASSYLQNHRRIHTGEKPHPCEVCGKPFRVRSDMKRHLKTHGRRRIPRPIPINSNLIVTKVEENETILAESDDTNENQKENENDNAVQSLQYEHETDPLDINVRDGSTLYVMPILIS